MVFKSLFKDLQIIFTDFSLNIRNTCFDCHLYKGRIINIVVRDSNTNGQIAEGSIDAEILATKAKDKVLHQDWVRIILSFLFYFCN